jgi:hypothetical protein
MIVCNHNSYAIGTRFRRRFHGPYELWIRGAKDEFFPVSQNLLLLSAIFYLFGSAETLTVVLGSPGGSPDNI